MTLKTPGFAYVYWIRKSEHFDYLTQGYIGVSTNPTQRWKCHIQEAKNERHCNKYLANVINKYYTSLEFEVIFAGTEKQCYEYESELRPKPSIGWNLMSGGLIGKPTEEGKKRISKASSRKWSETKKWEAYKKRHNVNISFAAYKDIIAIKKGKLPPSKLRLPVFNLFDCQEYSNLEEAAKNSHLSTKEIYELCEEVSDYWIYKKDLTSKSN